MEYKFRQQHIKINQFLQQKALFLAWGVLLALLGIAIIGVANFTDYISTRNLGVFIGIGGILFLIESVMLWLEAWKEFFLSSLVGVFYIITSLALIKHPVISYITLTYILSAFYLQLGLFRIIHALFLAFPTPSLKLVHGIISIIVCALLWMKWPQGNLYVMSLLLGIDFVCGGLTYIVKPPSKKSAIPGE